MREAHGEDVAEVTQGDEGGEGPRACALAKDVLEEDGGDEDLCAGNVLLGDGGKIGHVGEDVKDGDAADGQGRCDGEGAARVLELRDDVVCVLPPLVRVDDVEERVGVRVRAAVAAVSLAGVEGEGVPEVVRVVHEAVAGQRCEAGAHDEEQDHDLEDTEDVEEADSPLGRCGVKNTGECDARDTEATGGPAIGLAAAGGVEDVPSKGEGVARGEAEEQHLGGEDAGGEVLWAAVGALEVVLFAAGARDGEAELEEDGEAAEGEDAADDPQEEGDADGAG